MDLGDDRFDIVHDASVVAVADFLEAIRELGYEPQVITAPAEQAAVAQAIDPQSLPEDLETSFAAARDAGSLLILEFSGPG